MDTIESLSHGHKKSCQVNRHLACVRIKRSNGEMGCTQTVSFVKGGGDDYFRKSLTRCVLVCFDKIWTKSIAAAELANVGDVVMI